MLNRISFKSALATIGLSLGLGGCGLSGVQDVGALQSTTIQGGTPFTRALANEYRMEANDEANIEAEWGDAGWFARRGLRAAAGEVVPPAEPGILSSWHWTTPASDRMTMLAKGRKQLVSAFDNGARERVPERAAHVQRLFDCWVEEEAEAELNNACGPDFLRLVQGLGVAEAYRVFFDWDQSSIDAEGAEVIRQATNAALQGDLKRVGVTGYTDSSGGDAYNQALSERRAAAVRRELIHDGVPEHTIRILGDGEANQLVVTGDDVREARNRRALIVLQK